MQRPVMPSSHRRQDCFILSCPCCHCKQNWRQIKAVGDRKFSKLFGPVWKCGEDYWKQSWLVANSVHTVDKTREFCLVCAGSELGILVVTLSGWMWPVLWYWQKTEVFSVRKSDNARIMLTISYTNEIPPSAPNCLQLYNIIFKRSVVYSLDVNFD